MAQSFLKHAAVYGLGTMLVQAASFFLLPIYLRALTPDDYGVLEVVSRLAETLGAVLLLGGFRQALFAQYQQAEDDLHRRRVVTAAFLLLAIAAMVSALVLLLLSQLLPHDSVLSPTLLALAIFGVVVEPLSLLPLTLIQARVESGTYVVVVLAQFLLRITLCIILVRFLHWGVVGALTATAVTGAVVGLALSARELARGLAWPGWPPITAMLVFALPLVPSGLCFTFMNHGDRFFLLHHASEADVGTYSLGYKLAMVVRLLSLTPLYMVWSSRMYVVATQHDAPRQFGLAFTRLLAAYLYFGLGLCLFAEEVVSMLGGESFAAASTIVAPVVLAYLLQCAATLMDSGFFIRRRMNRKLWVTLAATVVMLALYALLIPPFGAMGAALATLGGFLALAALTHQSTQKIFYVEYEWPRLLALLALATLTWLLAHALPVSPWTVALKALLFLFPPLAAWWTGLVSEEEKHHTRSLARQLLAALRPARRQPGGSTA